MKTNYFKNFLSGLSNDDTREIFECMGYAFMQCTEKQIVKVVDIYKELGFTFEQNGRIFFGSTYAYSISTETYNKVKGESEV